MKLITLITVFALLAIIGVLTAYIVKENKDITEEGQDHQEPTEGPGGTPVYVPEPAPVVPNPDDLKIDLPTEKEKPAKKAAKAAKPKTVTKSKTTSKQ